MSGHDPRWDEWHLSPALFPIGLYGPWLEGNSGQGAPLLLQKLDGLAKIGVELPEVFNEDLALGRVLVLC